MKKQLKYIVITLVAALVVGLLALAAVLFVPDAADDVSSTISSQAVTIYDSQTADVVKFTVTNEHGSYEIVPKDSGNFHIAELEGYKVVTSSFNTFADTFSALEAKKLVTDTPENLSVYGFDEPLASLEIEFKDETITVFLGNSETTTNGYYCKTDKSDSVYLLTSGVGAKLLSDKLYYLEKEITPAYDTNEELTFDKVVLSGTVRDEIVIVPTPDSDDEDDTEIFAYEIIAPANAPYDISGTDFLTGFFLLYGDTVVEIAPDEETLKEYGFDNPYSVATIESSAADFTITVGKVDGEYCYVMNDTDDVIYRCPVTSVTWLDVQYQNLVSKMFLIPHIHTVSNVDIITADKSYKYTVSYDEEIDTVFAKCNSKTVNTANFQNFYQVLVSCYLENYNTERADGEPYMTLTYTYNEGGSDTVEFYLCPSDVRQYLIAFNGEYTDFSVRAVWVEKVLADCERLLSGQEVSTTWSFFTSTSVGSNLRCTSFLPGAVQHKMMSDDSSPFVPLRAKVPRLAPLMKKSAGICVSESAGEV